MPGAWRYAGLELLVFSAKHSGDAIMDPTLWPAETEAP